ncbi:hypothetical protein [Rubinisphaera italica]|nr:hypothetical protein [Rubinisphaera italica]
MLNDEGHVQGVVRRDVPMLCADWGAKDEDALVHTLGVNLLAALGRSFGEVGVSEFPVPRAQQWQRKLVRVDSAWFSYETRKPTLLAEFERFSRETAIEKLTNLCVAAHGCDAVPEVLLLCLWSTDGKSVEAPWLKPNEPLSVPGGPPVTKPTESNVFIVHAVFGRRGEQLHFLRFRRLT